MKTEEEKRAYRKAYYEKNKETIKQKAREKYAIKTADKPKRVAMTQDEINRKAREKYRQKHNIVNKMEDRAVAKKYNLKHKGFKFKFDDGVISFEVMLPFRIMEDRYAKRIDKEQYKKLYYTLKRKLEEVDKTKTIFVLEPSYIQYYTKNTDTIGQIADIVKGFIEEQVKIYGRYIKRGYVMGTDFQ